MEPFPEQMNKLPTEKLADFLLYAPLSVVSVVIFVCVIYFIKQIANKFENYDN